MRHLEWNCSRIVVFVALLVIGSGPLRATEADEIQDAQNCINDAEPGRNTLHCIVGIEHYTDTTASFVKCGARILNQGLDWTNFPWLMTISDETLWLTVVNKLSDEDLDLSTARLIQGDCFLSNSPLMKIFGDYYLLRAALLEFGATEQNITLAGLQSATDFRLKFRIQDALESIRLECDANDGFHIFAFCVEAMRLDSYPGQTPLDRFTESLALSLVGVSGSFRGGGMASEHLRGCSAARKLPKEAEILFRGFNSTQNAAVGELCR
jgi:hypothetical protein